MAAEKHVILLQTSCRTAAMSPKRPILQDARMSVSTVPARRVLDCEFREQEIDHCIKNAFEKPQLWRDCRKPPCCTTVVYGSC